MNLKQGVEDWQILQALVNGTSPRGYGYMDPNVGTGLSEDEAKALCANQRPRKRTYIDYCCGRPIKTYLDERPLDLFLYDRDAGEGAGERALRAAGLLEE